MRHFFQNALIILHDKAQPHAVHAVTYLLDRWGFQVLYHPPYLSDLNSCDFDLVPKMKELLHGIRFETDPEILVEIDWSF